jgi:predicted LPLAT superfamily acyltransferase
MNPKPGACSGDASRRSAGILPAGSGGILPPVSNVQNSSQTGDKASPSPSLRRGVAATPAWSGRTRGGYLGNWCFVQIIRRLGVRWAYGLLIFVAAYFTLCNPSGYRCSKDFLRRVLGSQPFWKWPLLVYCHFFSFGVTLLDRLAVIMGRAKIECTHEGEFLFKDYLDRGRGVILLGAHVGSWEIGGHLLGRFGKPVNVVVLEKDEARLRQLFGQALAAKQFNLIATDGHPLRSIPISAALRRGEIVCLLGDRSFGGADVRTPFLGSPARFPVGPYLLAAVSSAPIFQTFVVREKIGHYRFFSFPAKFIPREILRAGTEALQPHVAEYVARLAGVAKQYPFQWFNIYPFWDEVPAKVEDEKVSTAATAPAKSTP